MSRAALTRILGGALGFAALLAGCGGTDARSGASDAADSVWYHASDVARIGTTGRPQLLEFFHPG